MTQPVTTVSTTGAIGALRAWASSAAMRTIEAGCRFLRFAFYGRYSIEDRQNPVTSHAWQHDQAEVIDRLRRTAQTLTYYHPTKTLEVTGGDLPIRIIV